jgi:adenine-specific DNA glycosylase
MKIEQKHFEALETIIELAEDICTDTQEDQCFSCPFWHYCKYANETPAHMIENLFQKILDK